MSKKKTNNKKYLKFAVILLVIVGLFYIGRLSVQEYRTQSEAVGITICNDQECIKTMHIHSDVKFNLCGQEPVLPREVGPLSGLHTHKEKNYLHFHDQVDLDPETQAQAFDGRLSVQEIIDIFELDPEKYCGTDDVEIVVLVNNLPNSLDYNWVDGDQIELMYRAK